MDYSQLLIIYVIAWGVFSIMTLGFYAFDKRQAQKNNFRIRESSLLLLTALFGSIGALIGLYGLRHKTKHILFVVTTWTAFIIHSGVLVFLIFLATP